MNPNKQCSQRKQREEQELWEDNRLSDRQANPWHDQRVACGLMRLLRRSTYEQTPQLPP